MQAKTWRSSASIVREHRGDLVRMIILSLATMAVLMGCTVTSDGPFNQVQGAPIDYAKVDQLKENAASKAEVIAALGSPTRTTSTPDGVEALEYVSVRQRQSVSRTLGILHGRSTQTIEERVTMLIKAGVLVRKEKASSIH